MDTQFIEKMKKVHTALQKAFVTENQLQMREAIDSMAGLINSVVPPAPKKKSNCASFEDAFSKLGYKVQFTPANVGDEKFKVTLTQTDANTMIAKLTALDKIPNF